MATLNSELLELEQLVASVDEAEAGELNMMLEGAESLGEEKRLELTRELIHTLELRRHGKHTLMSDERAARINRMFEMSRWVEIGIEQGVLERCEKCNEVYPTGNRWPFCARPGFEFLSSEGHAARVIPRDAKGAADTVFYYNPRTKNVYMPGHDTRHFSPESRGYEKHSIGVREYGLKSKFYKFLDRLAVDRREKRLAQTEATFAPIFKENRMTLLRKLQTDFGKDALREAIKLTDSKDEKYERYDPGSHIEAWEFDEKNIRDGHTNDPNPSLDKFQPKHDEVKRDLTRRKEMERLSQNPREMREREEAGKLPER